MVTRSGSKGRALSFVLAFVCLCWAAAAFAQSATGTITGTVVDGTGAALPGATVNVTEAGDGHRSHGRHRRRGSLPLRRTEPRPLFPRRGARQFQHPERRGYRAAVDGSARPREARPADRRRHRDRHDHLGSHARPGGGQLETVHAHPGRHRRDPHQGTRHLRHAGRPARRAGHEPESRLHPVAFRDLDHHQRHALAEQGRPRRRHQHRRRGRMRHRLREPQHGRGRRSAGHRQRLHGGERPQQRRRHQHGDQVGHQSAAGVRLVQRPPRQVQRERLFPQGDQPGEAALPREYLRLQRRRPGGDPRPGRQPEVRAGRSSTSSARRNSPTTRGRRPRRARTCRRDSSTTGISRQTRITNGTIQPIIDPLTGQQFPGNRIPAAGTPGCGVAVQLHRPARSAHAADPAGSQQHPEPAGRSGVDVELGVGSDAGSRPDEQRPARGCRLHREDPHGDSRRQGPRRRLELEPPDAGHRLRQPEHARTADRDHRLAGAAADDGQRDRVRLHAQPLGIHGGRRLRLHVAVPLDAQRRSAAVRTVRGLLGSAARSRASASRSTSGRMRRDSRHRAAIGPGWPDSASPTSRFPA